MEHAHPQLDDAIAIKPRPRRKDDDEMDITPMIDITFLLLIFFLVASKLEESADIQLPPARHGLPVGERNAVVLTVTKGNGAEAYVYKGDKLDTASRFQGDAVQQDEAIAAYVEDELEGSTSKHYVLIKAEEDVKHGDVSRVAKAVGNAETAQQLYVAVMEET